MYFIKYLFINFLTTTIYFTCSSIWFVTTVHPNPIGISFLNLILVIVHFVILIIVALKLKKNNVIGLICSFFLTIFIYMFLFSFLIDSWLWSLR